MQFHNTPTDRYDFPMFATPPGTWLGRLRASTRVAVLVLLVFAMKIGLAAACAKHDFTDLGLGSDTAHQVAASASTNTDGDAPGKGALPHAGACNHCGCHHAAAVPVPAYALTAPLVHDRFGYASETGYSAPAPQELRPPIV